MRNKQGGAAGDGTPSKQETGLERPTSTRSPPKVQARADDADSVNSPALAIIHTETEDNFSGEPWPPDGADYWAIVKRSHGGFTLWRRVALEISHVDLAAERRALLSGGTQGNKTMTQELTMQSTEVENIHTAAQEDAGFEKILKFKKGEYLIGEELIPLGAQYLAHARAWTKCWIKFRDGEIAERKPYRVALGEKPPEREDLDNLDKTLWPEGLDGKPADPWVFQYLLPLEDLSTGEVVIFVASSFGGRRAIADLCAAYAKRAAKATICGQPIVKLAKAEMPTKKFGKVPRPLFEVVRWDDAADDVSPAAPLIALKHELDDEIPF